MGRCELTALAPLFAVFAIFTANLLLHPQGSVRADVGKFPSEPLAKSPSEPMAKSPAHTLTKSPAEHLTKSPAHPSTESPAAPPNDPHSPADLAGKMPLKGPANNHGPSKEREKGPNNEPAKGDPKLPPQPRMQPNSPPQPRMKLKSPPKPRMQSNSPPNAAGHSDGPNVYLNGPEMCSTDVLIDNFLKCLTCEKKKDVREAFAHCTKQSPDPKGIEVVLDQCEGHIFTANESPPERLLILCVDDHERTNLTTCLTGNMNRISAEPRHMLKPVTLFMRCAMSIRMEYCDK